MILKKIIAGLFLLFFLNGCVQSTALLGPAYTMASTGSIYHAGLSYGSNQAVKNITGKTPTENIKSLVDNKKMKKFFNYKLKYPTYIEGLDYIFNNTV